MKRRWLLAMCALLCAGCAKVPFGAPDATLDDGVYVEIDKAFVRGKDRVFIETFVSNNNDKTIRVDKDNWALKLPTGELISRRVGGREGDLYVIGPGQGQDIDVDFYKDGYDLTGLTEMTLIIGGVQIGESSTPYVVGEITLSRARDNNN